MRRSDTARLSTPFAEGADPRCEAASALGVAVPRWDELEATILADLKEGAPYGVSWWAPHPGTSRRILISDQLYACTHSVSDNPIEAALHWLEFLDFAGRYGVNTGIKERQFHQCTGSRVLTASSAGMR